MTVTGGAGERKVRADSIMPRPDVSALRTSSGVRRPSAGLAAAAGLPSLPSPGVASPCQQQCRSQTPAHSQDVNPAGYS